MQKKAAMRVNHLIEERQKSQNATLVGVKLNPNFFPNPYLKSTQP